MKEQAVEERATSAAPGRWGAVRGLDRPLPAAMQRLLVPGLFVVLALLVTTGYGSGVQLNDGQAALHINPLQFLGRLLHAWNPLVALGTHTGFLVPYQMPYSWLYGLAQFLHVPQDVAQHVAVFFVYLGCLWSMYYCLRAVAPWLDDVSRIAGSCAYLFNMYVALNSQAQIVWLLTYGTLPAMVGVMARAIRSEMNLWRAALAIALLVLVGGGVNPPLVAINVVVVAIFVIVAVVLDPQPSSALNRTIPVVFAASIAALAINLYWLVPFVDYFRVVWLNGVLSEAPSMHNAATSFANVLRGLGHWATFVSFDGRAYFPWAAAYASGIFGALLWLVPIVALGGVAFKRNQRPATLFFLIVTLVSVPLVVGYYHDQLGDAVTTPIYDRFYRTFPGFQMFRFSYKWVAGVEFGLCGLYALAAYAIVTALREYIARLHALDRRNWAWLVSGARTALIALPILIFIPVLIDKMNYPGQPIPGWEYRESALVGSDQRQRVALFPTQFLEQFDWGNPQFYIEDSLVDRPLVYGLLGSEPSEGSDMWVRRGYRVTREGLPLSANMFRVMGVDTILQRDDFIPEIDFSSPGESRFNSTTLTHDLLHRVIGATAVRSEGPLRIYHLGGALPLVYGVVHPVVSTLPAFTDAYLGDIDAMAAGRAAFDPLARTTDEFSPALQSLSPILPGSTTQIRDLAVNEALAGGIRIHPASADAAALVTFDVAGRSAYAVFAFEQSLVFAQPAPKQLAIDGKKLSARTAGGAWTGYGEVRFNPGRHWVSDGHVDPNLVVALVHADDLQAWENRISTLGRALPRNRATTRLVYAPNARVMVATPGTYRIRATAIGPFGPDALMRTHVRAPSGGSVFSGLGTTLPYVFGPGVVATSPIMMPAQWYRDDLTMYDWQRGDPLSWFLFPRHCVVRIFVPGHANVRAGGAMRLSRLQVAGVMSIRVRGGSAQSVALPGPAASAAQYDTIDRIDGPTPVAVRFSLDLHPGWNAVAFDFGSGSGDRIDGGFDVISAAVAPDLSFTIVQTRRSASVANDASFTALAVGRPPAALDGDPDIIGRVSNTAGRGTSLAVALAHDGKVVYRLFPIVRGGAFDISFMHAFPNDWDDASEHVVGMWLLARGYHPKFANIDYDLHAEPKQNLHHPASLSELPITVDGKSVGGSPVFLSRGSHLVATGDPQVNIGLLSLEPIGMPQPRDVRLVWRRQSATAIEVAAKSVTTPFLLVFGESYHPEWSAAIGGRVLPHVVVDGVANGWIVPSLPSGGQISLRFTGQKYYVVALAISVVALLIAIVLAWAPQLLPFRSVDR